MKIRYLFTEASLRAGVLTARSPQGCAYKQAFLVPPGSVPHSLRWVVRLLALILLRFFRIFASPNCILNFAWKKHRKKCENHRFWPPKALPKPCQNPVQIDVPKNMRFFIDFSWKNALSQECRHWFRIGFSNTKWLSDTFLHVVFFTHFRSEKPTKNLMQTKPEPFKNRCQKHAVS